MVRSSSLEKDLYIALWLYLITVILWRKYKLTDGQRFMLRSRIFGDSKTATSAIGKFIWFRIILGFGLSCFITLAFYARYVFELPPVMILLVIFGFGIRTRINLGKSCTVTMYQLQYLSFTEGCSAKFRARNAMLEFVVGAPIDYGHGLSFHDFSWLHFHRTFLTADCNQTSIRIHIRIKYVHN